MIDRRRLYDIYESVRFIRATYVRLTVSGVEFERFGTNLVRGGLDAIEQVINSSAVNLYCLMPL
jgi:hypothetical protein